MIDEKKLDLLDYQIHNGDYGFADLTQVQQAELIRLARLGLWVEKYHISLKHGLTLARGDANINLKYSTEAQEALILLRVMTPK